MKKADTIRIATHVLGRRVEVLGLKQWWIARELGVTRKTVSRWLTGKVKRAARENLVALAELLDCELETITERDEADVLATREEQSVAARLIQERGLTELLAPTDEWALAESLIKASMQPDLPLRSLGQLYCSLSLVTWRQGRYDEARGYADRAMELAHRCEDAAIAGRARLQLAVIAHYTGRVPEARDLYEQCIARPELLESRAAHASGLSNLGTIHRALGDFEESVRAQREAIRIFGEAEKPLNLAIAFVSLAIVRVEAGAFDEALAALDQADEYARSSNYRRGLQTHPIYRADALTLRDGPGDREQARALVVEHLPAVTEHAIFDLTSYEITARVQRRVGDFAAARAALDAGLARSAELPEIHGFMRMEEARRQIASGDDPTAAVAAAAAAFDAAGLEARRDACSDVLEYGLGTAVEAVP